VFTIYELFTVSGTVRFNGVATDGLEMTYLVDDDIRFLTTDGGGLYSITADVGEIVEIRDIVHPTLDSRVDGTMPVFIPGTTTANFSLIQVFFVTGVVEDTSGNTLEDMEIWYDLYDTDGFFVDNYSESSDEYGKFSIMADIGYSVIIYYVDPSALSDDYRMGPGIPTASISDYADFTIVMIPTFTVLLTVNAEDPLVPVSGAIVSYNDGTGITVAEDMGFGVYSMTADVGNTIIVTSVTYDDGGVWVYVGPALEYDATDDDEIDLTMISVEFEVLVVVKDAGGPLQDATVTFEIVDLMSGLVVRSGSVLTNGSGEYTILAQSNEEVWILDVFFDSNHVFSGTYPDGITSDSTETFVLDKVSYTISGRVTANGLGVSGVTVEYFIVGDTTYDATTDALGYYSFTVPAGKIVNITHVLATGYDFVDPGLPFNFTDGATNVDFILEAVFYDVSGIVKDAWGNPLVGVAVVYEIYDPSNVLVAAGFKVTDGDGKFIITVQEGNLLIITELVYDYDASRTDPALPWEFSDTDDVVITLYETFTVSGIVEDKDGNPLAGAVIDFELWDRVTGIKVSDGTFTTDADGLFSRTIDSMYDLKIVDVTAAEPDFRVSDGIPTGLIKVDESLTIVMIPTFTVILTVNVDGTPMAGIDVLYDDGTGVMAAFHNLDGTYTMTADVGNTITVLSAPYSGILGDYVLGLPLPQYTAGGDESIDLILIVTDVEVTITVTDDGANALAGAVVDYEITDGGIVVRTGTGVTDGSGECVIMLQAGELVTITNVWYSDNYSLVGTYPEDIDADAIIELTKDFFNVTGRVTSNGIGVDGVEIWYSVDGSDIPVPVLTDAFGYYNISGIAMTSVLVIEKVELISFALEDPLVVPTAGFTDDDVMDFFMEPVFYYVSGEVVDVLDAGLFGAVVSYEIYNEGSLISVGSVETDGTGYFIIPVREGNELVITEVTYDVFLAYRVDPLPPKNYDDTAFETFVIIETFTVSGVITFNGDETEFIEIEYTVDGGLNTEFAYTNEFGEYSITADKGDILEFLNIEHPSLLSRVVEPLGSYTDDEDGADYSLIEQYMVSGIVTFNDAPKAGIEVTFTTDGGLTYDSVDTNALGYYEILFDHDLTMEIISLDDPILTSRVVESLPQEFNASEEEVDFTMIETYVVSGVISLNDIPMIGIVVTYTLDDGTEGSVTTDIDGEYSITFDYDLVMTIESIENPTMQTRVVPDVLPKDYSDNDDAADYNLIPTFTVSGVVKDNSGNVLEGADVYYDLNGGAAGSVPTDADGIFMITADVGDDIRITDVVIEDFRISGGIPTGIITDAASVDVVMIPTFTVVLTVNAEDPLVPVFGAFVFYDDGNGIKAAYDNGDGTYSMTADVGKTIAVTSVTYNDGSDWVFLGTYPTYPSAGEDEIDLEEITTDFTLTVTIVDGNGNLLYGARIDYVVTDAPGGAGNVIREGSALADDVNAQFSIPGEAGEFVTITNVWYSDNYSLVGSSPVDPADIDYDAAITMILGKNSFVISGTVTSNGIGVEGVAVDYVIGGGVGAFTAETDEYGDYTITVPFGNWMMFVNVSKVGYYFDESTIPGGSYTDDDVVDFVIVAVYFTVTITIEDAFGNPLNVTVLYSIIDVNGVVTPGSEPVLGIFEMTLQEGMTLRIDDIVYLGYDGQRTDPDPKGMSFTADGGEDFIIYETFTVSWDLVNVTSDNDQDSADAGDDIVFTLSEAVGYRLPDTIRVTMAGVVDDLVVGVDYDYDPATGDVIIYNVTGNVSIIVTATKIWGIDATDMTNVTAPGIPSSIDAGEDLEFTLLEDAGYRLPDTITVMMGGSPIFVGFGYDYDPLTGDVIIYNVTGDVVIIVAGVEIFVIDVSVNDTTNNAPGTIDAGDDLVFTLVADPGFRLPDSIFVSMGIELVEGTDYTYDPLTGEVVVFNVTDQVNITGIGVAIFVVSGTVTINGGALGGVEISYTVDGTANAVVTNDLGVYSITADDGQKVIITAVTLNNHTVVESLPTAEFTSDATADFTMTVNPSGSPASFTIAIILAVAAALAILVFIRKSRGE